MLLPVDLIVSSNTENLLSSEFMTGGLNSMLGKLDLLHLAFVNSSTFVLAMYKDNELDIPMNS